VQGGQNYFRFVEGTCTSACVFILSLSLSLSLSLTYLLQLDSEAELYQVLNSDFSSRRRKRNHNSTPPSCVFLTFIFHFFSKGYLPSKMHVALTFFCTLSYPHFGPKNTCSNFFLFPIISSSRCLFYNFYCATNAHFAVRVSNFLAFKAVQSVFLHYKSSKRVSRTIACFPAFYSNFCIKSYKRVFWSFPTKEPILVPTICP